MVGWCSDIYCNDPWKIPDAFPSYKPPWPGISAKIWHLKGEPAIVHPTISSSGSSHPPRCTPRAVRRADACYASAAHLPRKRGGWALNLHPMITIWGVPPDCLHFFTTIKNHDLLDFSWLKCLLDFTSLDLRNFAHVVVLYRDLHTYFLTYPQCWSCQKHERWGGGVPFSICRCFTFRFQL